MRLLPKPDESLPGFVRRLAEANYLTDTQLLHHAGLGTHFDRPAFWGLIATERQRVVARDQWDVQPHQVDAMVLEGFPGFRLEALHGHTPKGAARDAQRAQWLHLSETRYCPQCWAEGYRGRLSWRSPFALACPDHTAVLADFPPAPGQHDAPKRASTRVLELHNLAMAPAHHAHVTLWGAPVAAFHAWQIWRGVACLLAAAGTVPRWTARPWLSPPRSPQLTERVLRQCAPTLLADDVSQAAIALASTEPRLRELHVTGALPDLVGPHPQLRSLTNELAQVLGRPSTMLRYRAQQLSLLHPDARIEWIPTLAPPEWLPPKWRGSTQPGPLIQRAVVASAAARLAGAITWRDAGEQLGIAPHCVTSWVRYLLRHVGPDGKTELADAATSGVARSVQVQLSQRRPSAVLASVADLQRWSVAEATPARDATRQAQEAECDGC